jgi:hypothetical protein
MANAVLVDAEPNGENISITVRKGATSMRLSLPSQALVAWWQAHYGLDLDSPEPIAFTFEHAGAPWTLSVDPNDGAGVKLASLIRAAIRDGRVKRIA